MYPQNLIALIHNHEPKMPSREVATNLLTRIQGVVILEVSFQANFSEKVIVRQLFSY